MFNQSAARATLPHVLRFFPFLRHAHEISIWMITYKTFWCVVSLSINCSSLIKKEKKKNEGQVFS